MEEEDEKKSQNNEGIISESDLLDLYDFQYNDLFSKILKINEEKFFGILQEQVILNLRIINKLSDLSLMSYFQEFIGERYKTEKKKITNDIEKLKIKVDSGVEFLVTQMFFDNDVMYNYMYRLLAHGITVPVVPGVMPVTNAKQIQHICKLSGTKLPLRFRAIVEKYGDDPEAMKQAGINYATAQVLDLLANGFMDVHIYTMNRPEIIGGILKNLSCIVK